MDRKSIRKLIQQEISRMEEEILLPPPKPGDHGYLNYLEKDYEDLSNIASEYSLSCKKCQEPFVMEGGCGCNGSYMNNLPSSGLYDIELELDSGGHHEKSGAYMSHPQLHRIKKYAEDLQHMIPENYDLEDWIRSHISQIADDISEVYHKLEYRFNNMD